MKKSELKGLVILLKSDKSLVQTKRIRICQREKLVDKMCFLIPMEYEGEDMTNYKVMMVYKTADATPHMEGLERKSDGYGGYVNYEDADGNETHMIYELPVDTQFTKLAGDITIMLSLQYVDYEDQTESSDDESDSPTPSGTVQHVFNTLTTIVEVLTVTDYYSIVTDESLSMINNFIAKLEAEAEELSKGKADNISLDTEDMSIYLTSQGKLVGDKVALNDLGDAISDDTDSGLVKVIT